MKKLLLMLSLVFMAATAWAGGIPNEFYGLTLNVSKENASLNKLKAMGLKTNYDPDAHQIMVDFPVFENRNWDDALLSFTPTGKFESIAFFKYFPLDDSERAVEFYTGLLELFDEEVLATGEQTENTDTSASFIFTQGTMTVQMSFSYQEMDDEFLVMLFYMEP